MAFSSNRSANRILNKNLKAMQFLEQMNKVIPWKEFVSMIEKHIPEVREELGGRPKIETIKKLKMYFLSLWFSLSDIQAEEGIYDRASFQRFMDLDVTTDQIPDSTTLCNFRNFLHKNKLGENILSIVNEYMKQSGIILTEGKIIDAKIIKAPSSTKNKQKKRDPEMSSTKKNNTFHFGAKVHIATDEKGIITEVKTTTAKVHDSTMYDDITSDSDTRTLGDSAYIGDPLQKVANSKGIVHVAIIKRKRGEKELPIHAKLRNTLLSMPRKVVEFPFGVIKDIRGHRKTRYRGLAKLHTQRCILASLCNLYRVRGKLMTMCFSL